MIDAERTQAYNDAYFSALSIDEKEVELVANYLNNVGIIAAVILGFAENFWSPDFYDPFYDENEVLRYWLVGAFFVTASLSVGFLLFTVTAVMVPLAKSQKPCASCLPLPSEMSYVCARVRRDLAFASR